MGRMEEKPSKFFELAGGQQASRFRKAEPQQMLGII
jgi:hypothetical protein